MGRGRGQHKKNKGKKDKKQPVLVATDQSLVTCRYCHKSDKPETIVVDEYDSDKSRYFWHCLPQEFGDQSPPKPVCLDCTFKHRQELKKQFPQWFRPGRQNLPVLIHTLERQRKWREQEQAKDTAAWQKAEEFKKRHGIDQDESKVCSGCGHFHGQLVQTGEAYYTVVQVRWVNGFQRTKEAVMAQLLCDQCAKPARQKNRVFPLDKTLLRFERLRPPRPQKGGMGTMGALLTQALSQKQ